MESETEKKTTSFIHINPRMLPISVISSTETENSLAKNEGRNKFILILDNCFFIETRLIFTW